MCSIWTSGARCREEERFQRLMDSRINRATSNIDTGRSKHRHLQKRHVIPPTDSIVRELQQLEGTPAAALVLLNLGQLRTTATCERIRGCRDSKK
jgi:hypothetical protein